MVEEYTMSIQRSIGFLYTSNKGPEKDTRAIPFIIIKYPGICITQEASDLYSETLPNTDKRN